MRGIPGNRQSNVDWWKIAPTQWRLLAGKGWPWMGNCPILIVIDIYALPRILVVDSWVAISWNWALYLWETHKDWANGFVSSLDTSQSTRRCSNSWLTLLKCLQQTKTPWRYKKGWWIFRAWFLCQNITSPNSWGYNLQIVGLVMWKKSPKVGTSIATPEFFPPVNPPRFLDRSEKLKAFQEAWPVVAVLLYRKHVVSLGAKIQGWIIMIFRSKWPFLRGAS